MVEEEDPWDWSVGGIPEPNTADKELFPALSAIAGLLLVKRIELRLRSQPKTPRIPIKQIRQRENERSRTARMSRVWEERLREARESIANMPPEAQNPIGDTAEKLRDQVHKRLPERLCLGLLISAWSTNPLAPFEVKVGDRVLELAVSDFADDLGVPASWAKTTQKTVDEAKRNLEPNRLLGWAVTIVGIGAMIAAAPLVLAAAPATVTGGAVIMAGLAALGPGGMIGGLAIVTALAGVGGITATAGAFVAGTPKQVAENVTVLHATALAKRKIRPGHPSNREHRLLDEMAAQLKAQRATHKAIDDKPSAVLRALKKKHSYVDKALADLKQLKEKGQ